MQQLEEMEAIGSKIDWPADVEFILSAIDSGRKQGDGRYTRRSLGRMMFRTEARLRLFSEPPGSAPWVLYTRDANRRGIGFLSRNRLPLGYGGLLELVAPNGHPLAAHGTLFRCREAAPGWYEGALYFNRDQFAFDPPAAGGK